ncbi:MAG TPA: hypothetical protein QF695_16175, partial [Arenicellales bacterium]|nr:hypothetical protein [Arenicellales bacterium]
PLAHAPTYRPDRWENARHYANPGSRISLLRNYRLTKQAAWFHLCNQSRHNDIIGIHVSDPMERELPRPDLYTITDGQQRTQINTADSGHRINYHQHYLEHLEVIRTEFTKTKSPLFEVSTEDKLISTLAEAYEKFRMVNR